MTSHHEENQIAGTKSIRIGTAVAALALASMLTSSASWAQTRVLEYDATRTTSSIDTSDEVEVKNDVGESLGVTIENDRPIEVIERPPNASYILYQSGFLNIGLVENYTRTMTVPVGSHMQGLSISVRTDGAMDRCRFSLTYPYDASQRPAHQSIFIASAEFASGPGNYHLPLYDLYVGEDVELTLRFIGEGESRARCWMNVGLHMRPVPGGVSGDVGGFGF